MNRRDYSPASSPLQERQYSINTLSSTSPSPPPKRRKLTPMRQISPSTSKPSTSQLSSALKSSKPNPANESPQVSAGHLYLGDFIAEAWSTTSDLKGSTYLSNGDPVLIQRDDADARPFASSTFTSSTNGLSKANGGQTKLAFAPKLRAVPNKRSSSNKENNIIRFLNSKGSGLCTFLRQSMSNSYSILYCE